ncbi:MAG: serine/threonine protein kinase [Anaerolineae bacterium]|nr:serine/threonine protein kinase [Anaerolineae bacterium]
MHAPLRQLGQYEIIEELGHGGMSTVYRARQASMGREVAIKVLAAELAREKGFMERFTKEVQLIALLEHPHILPVIDYGETNGAAYLVMRFLQGGSLSDRIKQGPFSLSEANAMLNQIASALDYAHRRGVIHRDLKPSNILMDKDGNCYLTDFGIAKIAHIDDGLTTTGHVMGTPAYMSPEQGLGLPINGRADIYALGLILYEMLVRRRPFTADSPPALIFQHVYHPPPRPTVLNPDLPQAVEEVVLKALAKRPEERYQTPMDLANAFDYALTGDATHTTRLSRTLSTDSAPTLVNAGVPLAIADEGTTLAMSDSERQVPPLPVEAVSVPAPAEPETVRQPRRARMALLGVVFLAVAFIGVFALSQFAPGGAMAPRQPPPQPTPRHAIPRHSPPPLSSRRRTPPRPRARRPAPQRPPPPSPPPRPRRRLLPRPHRR